MKSCKLCNYITGDLSNFERHKRTLKHLQLFKDSLLNGSSLHDNTTTTTTTTTENIDIDLLDKVRDNKINEPKEINNKREIKIKDGEISPFPNTDPNQTDALFVAGPRGSGKSYFCSDYISLYKKVYPKNRFILFSTKPEDECLDKLRPLRIEINDELLEEPIELDELRNSLVLFDDIDGTADKELKAELFRLYNLILQNGRSYGITVIITYHNITDYKMTRETLNNSSHCVIFPQSGATAQNKYMLKTYCGLEKYQIDKIMSLDSRWVMIKKYAPMMVIYSKGVYFL